MALFRCGRYEEAEPLVRQALEVRRKVRGEEHEDTLWSMSGLAVLLKFRMCYVCIAHVSTLYYMSVCHMRHNTCRKLAGYVNNTYSTSVVRQIRLGYVYLRYVLSTYHRYA